MAELRAGSGSGMSFTYSSLKAFQSAALRRNTVAFTTSLSEAPAASSTPAILPMQRRA